MFCTNITTQVSIYVAGAHQTFLSTQFRRKKKEELTDVTLVSIGTGDSVNTRTFVQDCNQMLIAMVFVKTREHARKVTKFLVKMVPNVNGSPVNSFTSMSNRKIKLIK